MATLYFNAAVDNDWDEIGNWWTSGAFSTQASALPTSSDSVVLSETCDTNSGSAPTVVNLTVNDPSYNSFYLGIAISVTGDATFNGGSQNNNGSVTGNVVFNDSSSNDGAITGNANFNDSSSNYYGYVTNNANFNDSSSNYYGYVAGNATFNDNSFNDGTIAGNATFNGSSFNDGAITGDATFNDSSQNDSGGTVTGNATFHDGSFNREGAVAGDAKFFLTAASVQIAYGYYGSYGSISFSYEKGINGSSILGIV